MNDYTLDADRIWAYESYSPTLFQISGDGEDHEQALHFGFTTSPTPTKPVDAPDPWMWWH